MKNSQRFHDLWKKLFQARDNSYFFLLFQTEGQLEVFDMKNRNHLHIKCFALCQSLKMKIVGTLKWPIDDEVLHFVAATRSENSQWAQTTEKRDELLTQELFSVFYYFLVWASFVLRHLAIVKPRNWNSPELKWVREGDLGPKED